MANMTEVRDRIIAFLDEMADGYEIVQDTATGAIFGFTVDNTDYSMAVNKTP